MQEIIVNAQTGEVIARELSPEKIEERRTRLIQSLTQADYSAAIEAHLEAVAQSRGYRDATRLASYIASRIPQWKAEADAFVAWRDEVWTFSYSLMAKVMAGEEEKPTIEELIEALPKIVWPEVAG